MMGLSLVQQLALTALCAMVPWAADQQPQTACLHPFTLVAPHSRWCPVQQQQIEQLNTRLCRTTTGCLQQQQQHHQHQHQQHLQQA